MRIAISEELKIARMQHRGDTWEAISGRLKSGALTTTDVNFGQIPIIDLNEGQELTFFIHFILNFESFLSPYISLSTSNALRITNFLNSLFSM